MVRQEEAIPHKQLSASIHKQHGFFLDYKDISKQFANKVYLNDIMLAYGQIVWRN